MKHLAVLALLLVACGGSSLADASATLDRVRDVAALACAAAKSDGGLPTASSLELCSAAASALDSAVRAVKAANDNPSPANIDAATAAVAAAVEAASRLPAAQTP